MPTDVNGIPAITGQAGHAAVGRPGPGSPTVSSTRGASSTPDDTVELQSVARARELAESVRDQPLVDGQRVQELRNAIASGQYQVDSTRVAEKLIAFEARLPRSGS